MNNVEPASNFIRSLVAEAVRQNALPQGHIVTRFPPEPNGFLHIGHAKSICLNFGLARDFAGVCHLRFDDTNPTKEDVSYADSIIETVRWLGFDFGSHLYYASDYFTQCYEYAVHLIKAGLAYVDTQTPEQIRLGRGTLVSPGTNSPDRDLPWDRHLNLFECMKSGEFSDGLMVLRLRIDMESPNMNLRDPVIYRIRHQAHWRTGEAWCIYPMYDYAHAISDALEHITHSICTLEFEDHRPLYDWVVTHVPVPSRPHQYEFSRLNLSHTLMSKRKLLELVESGVVEGWDDPRMPTLAGLRRRGYTPAAIRLFCDRIGVSKADGVINVSVLEDCLREDLNAQAQRRVAILDPLLLVIDNFDEQRVEWCVVPNHPQKPELGTRLLGLTKYLWIEREDFREEATKGFFRLIVGGMVRLRYGYVVRCTHLERDNSGQIVSVHVVYDPATKSGTPGADQVKVKGNIHWLSRSQAHAGRVHRYDHLFTDPNPAALVDYRTALNPQSKAVQSPCFFEAALGAAKPLDVFQFERMGYFVTEKIEPDDWVFGLSVALKETTKRV